MFSDDCDKPLVSIILPLFNAKKYIYQTLRSIQNQTYQNIEVIVIDDGSTDGSKEICEKFVDSDTRFKLYSKKNTGISNTRNVAIHKAVGRYIAFCDHDDCMDINLIQELLNIIVKNDADIAFANYSIQYIDQSGQYIKKINAGLETGIYTKQEILEKIPFMRKSFQSVWNGLYKKELFLENNIFFDETMKSGGEDITLNYQLLQFANKIVTTDKILYYHFKRIGQSASTFLNENRIDAIIKFSEMEEKIIWDNVEDNKWKKIAIACERMANLSLILTVLVQSGADEKTQIQELKRIRKNSKIDFCIKNGESNACFFMIHNFPKRWMASILFRFKLYKILLKLSRKRAN